MGPAATPWRESSAAATLVPETVVEKTPSPASETEKGSSGWEKKKVRQAESAGASIGPADRTHASQSVEPAAEGEPGTRGRQTGEWNLAME
jgi:hypothetical protein